MVVAWYTGIMCVWKATLGWHNSVLLPKRLHHSVSSLWDWQIICATTQWTTVGLRWLKSYLRNSFLLAMLVFWATSQLDCKLLRGVSSVSMRKSCWEWEVGRMPIEQGHVISGIWGSLCIERQPFNRERQGGWEFLVFPHLWAEVSGRSWGLLRAQKFKNIHGILCRNNVWNVVA